MAEHEHFRALIEAKLATISKALETGDADTDTVELDQTRVGRLSRMDAMQVQQMQLALSRRQQTEMAALGHALKRLEQGEYGECLECGEDINPKRLEIDLTATLCIDCAAKREAGAAS